MRHVGGYKLLWAVRFIGLHGAERLERRLGEYKLERQQRVHGRKRQHGIERCDVGHKRGRLVPAGASRGGVLRGASGDFGLVGVVGLGLRYGVRNDGNVGWRVLRGERFIGLHGSER